MQKKLCEPESLDLDSITCFIHCFSLSLTFTYPRDHALPVRSSIIPFLYTYLRLPLPLGFWIQSILPAGSFHAVSPWKPAERDLAAVCGGLAWLLETMESRG